MTAAGEPQPGPGLSTETILALADGSLLERFQGVAAKVVSALDEALEVAGAIQDGSRDRIVAVLGEIAAQEEPDNPAPELLALREIFGTSERPGRLSSLVLTGLGPVAATEDLHAFAEAAQADADMLPARRQHRETTYSIAESAMKAIQERGIFPVKEKGTLRLEEEGRMPKDERPFIYSYRSHEYDGGEWHVRHVLRSPFVNISPVLELAISRVNMEKESFKEPAEFHFRLVTKIEGSREDDHLCDPNSAPYAHIPSAEGSVVSYMDPAGDPRKLDSRVAEANDRQLIANLQATAKALEELSEETAAGSKESTDGRR
jgi:hypothetical protein